MNLLDNKKYILRLDRSQMHRSIEELELQFRQTWREIDQIKLPPAYRKVDNIVLNGMGGSGLAGRLSKTLFNDRLSIPIDHIHDYLLPRTVTQNTLYIVASYSGNTEEPVSTVAEAIKRRAKIIIIAQGGHLAQLSRRHHLPAYIFEERYNPSRQPRMGLGYNLGSLMGILKKLGIIKIGAAEFYNALKILGRINKKISLGCSTQKNVAKKIALKLYNKVPIIITSEFLEGNAHIMRNQINENGKNLADYHIIPELNHHLLEGLIYPKSNKQNCVFLFFESKLFHPRTQKRYQVTQKVLTRQGIKWYAHQLIGKSRLAQSFEMLLIGSYISFYLAMLNRINPSPIPWVDYFKKELGKK